MSMSGQAEVFISELLMVRIIQVEDQRLDRNGALQNCTHY